MKKKLCQVFRQCMSYMSYMVRLALKRIPAEILLPLRERHHLCRTQVTTGDLPRSPVAIVFRRSRSTLTAYAKVEHVDLDALSEKRGQDAYRFSGLASRCHLERIAGGTELNAAPTAAAVGSGVVAASGEASVLPWE